MACRRLTFQNGRAFEVEIESADIAGELQTTLCKAVIYRVTNDAREYQPLQRLDGGPLAIIATGEDAVIEIARHVLSDVTGSSIDAVGECGSRSMLPPLPSRPR